MNVTLFRRAMKAAAGSQTSKSHGDESFLIFLPESLAECPHFIRCTDIKSMKENCNKHLKESQEWRQIALDLFQCDCPLTRSLLSFSCFSSILQYRIFTLFICYWDYWLAKSAGLTEKCTPMTALATAISDMSTSKSEQSMPLVVGCRIGHELHPDIFLYSWIRAMLTIFIYMHVLAQIYTDFRHSDNTF